MRETENKIVTAQDQVTSTNYFKKSRENKLKVDVDYAQNI